jgi:tetratricopeptide (TPR) repeat protein
MQLGEEHRALGLLDEAAPPDRSLLEEDDDESYKIKIGRAELAVQRGDLAAARTLLDEVMSPHAAALPSSRTASNFVGLLCAKLLAAEGVWDAAVIEFSRAARVGPGAELHVLVLAREGLCQIALARGDIADARREIADLIRVAGPCLDAWGTGILLRIAEVTLDVYPDEIFPLLEATFVSAKTSQWTDTMVVIQCLRARRALRLDRTDFAHEELVRAKRWIRVEDPSEVHASVCLSEAEVALAAGVEANEDIAALLVRARELFRPTAPRQAAISGTLLGACWRHLRRVEAAVDAYRVAADDARAARIPTLVAHAELGELAAAVEGGVEQDDVMDRLRAVADRYRAAEQALSEGIARADLGRCLLRRGFREAASIELEQARACFVATTDAISESRVVELLDAAR